MKNASFYILAILVLGLIGNPLSQHALNYQDKTNINTLGVNVFAESDEDEQETHDDKQESEHDESEGDSEENNDRSDDSEDEEHEDENQDEENTSEEDAKEAISDAQEEIKKSQEKIMGAKQKGKDTSASELALEEAQNKLEEAQQNFEFGAYEMAEESADEAEDLASDARMSLLGKSIEDEESEDDELEDESDEDLDESEDDMEDSEDDADDNKQDRQKSEAKTEQIISKLEQKIEQLEQRIQSLLEKVQNGKYFGNLENTDQTTKSYTLSFDGTATSIQDQGVSAPVSADVFVETLVTKDGYSKLRVTGGQVDIGQTTYDIVFGKARVTDSQSDQGIFILLVAEIMDDNGDITTIRMNLDSAQSFQMADTQPVDLQIGSPQSKIAGQWFLEGTGSLSS